MALTSLLHGFGAALYSRDETIFAAVAKRFNLDVNEVRTASYKAVDSSKPKSIKPQKRQAKPFESGNKKKRMLSAYQIFVNDNRKIAEELILNDPSERIVTKKNGLEEKIDITGDKAKFGQVTKKIAAMWHALDTDGRAPFYQKAAQLKSDSAVEEESLEEEKVHVKDEELKQEAHKKKQDSSNFKSIPVKKVPPRKIPDQDEATVHQSAKRKTRTRE